MTLTEPAAGTNPYNHAPLYATVNGTGGTEITDQINSRICPIVGRQGRTTNSPSFNSTTKVRILQVNAPVRNGRTYKVLCFGELTGSAATDVYQSEIRITTNGVDPVVTDTQIGRGLITTITGAIPLACIIEALFVCTANATLKAMVCSFRAINNAGGSGVWEAGAGREMFMLVQDCGPTISPAGVVY